MFVIEWLGAQQTDGPKVLAREVCSATDLISAIGQAKSLLDKTVDFPDSGTIAIRVVNENGLQLWIGFVLDADLILTSRSMSR
jgi:hypothetical protein